MHSLWALILVLISTGPLPGWEAKRSACPQSCRKAKVKGEQSLKKRVGLLSD